MKSIESKNFRSKNLLVTGGAGFIGSNFIKHILKNYQNFNLINIDLLTYASNIDLISFADTYKNYNFIQGDICDAKLIKQIFNEYNIDGVINFAAETHVDNSIKSPEKFIETNINGVFNLLNIAKNHWQDYPFKFKKGFQQSRFHQISTDEVYGSINENSFSEESNYSPNSPYSASKASADMITRSFNKTYGLDTTISISSNNYGFGQNPEKFIPKIINNLVSNKTIPIYGDGLNIRDWIDVSENCRAIDLIFNFGRSGNSYNIGGNNEIRNIDIIKLIGNLLKINIEDKIKHVEDRYGHDYRYSLNCEKIKNELGWFPNSDFKENISELLKKYKILQ